MSAWIQGSDDRLGIRSPSSRPVACEKGNESLAIAGDETGDASRSEDETNPQSLAW